MGSPSAAPLAAPSARSVLVWTWRRFAELGVDSLYDLLALRARVFILEQGPYLDPDGADRHSGHLLGRDSAGELQAYLRIVDPGLKYAEPSMGRVVTTGAARGIGLGRELVRRALAAGGREHPGLGVRIGAQSRLEKFYADFGFAVVGERYIEDGIPHTEMFRPPDPAG